MNFSHTAVHMNFCSQMQEKMMCFFLMDILLSIIFYRSIIGLYMYFNVKSLCLSVTIWLVLYKSKSHISDLNFPECKNTIVC